MLLIVYCCFLLNTFLQTVDSAFQILLLVFVLFNHVRVVYLVFYFGVVYVGMQVLISSLLQLLVVVDVPRGFVYVRLEVLDVGALNPDLGATQRDKSIHLFLFGAQVVNNAAQILVIFIEFSQFLVHLQRLSFKKPDVFIERCDVFF